MTRLPALKPREVLSALLRAGFVEHRQTGSHKILVKGEAQVILPLHSKDMKKGTLHRIIKDAGFDVEEFLKLI
ncbi:MAG TPA: type II toxin-antitoxin system HicA family toxin [Dehalococcoidia bacterium]|nr:type II toxin-antitoxin system HicA family toxin [Dehalococcoidia bacterium]